MKTQSGYARMFAWLMVCLLSLSCSLVTLNQAVAPEKFGLPTRTAQQAVEPQQDAPQPVEPRPETGDVRVDYVYTSNLITVIYPLYGSILDDFAILTITNTRSTPAQVVITSEVTGYTDAEIDTLTVPPGEAVELRQNPRLIPSVIDELNVEKTAQFHVRAVLLEDGQEKLLLEETGETLVYARRDFPWSIPGFTSDEVFDLIAAMSTPNDPAVEELIRHAADYTDSGIMWSGYGGHVNDDDGAVWERLEAIWQAEEEIYDLTYVSTWVSYAPGSVQRIRLPGETLEQRSGNCIELALLFAAAAEAVDLETALVRIPGHAFMGVRIDQENADYYFVETTMIGRASFEDAVAYGGEEFEEALAHMQAGEDFYSWVTVWEARENGILPLPWR